MKAFKVLRNKNGRRFSSVTTPLALRYFVTKTNRPTIKRSKLFVFKTQEDAERFRKDRPLEIWEVEVPRLFRASSMISAHTTKKFAAKYWRNRRAIGPDLRREVPRGTRFVKQLKLIRKLS